MIAKQRLTRSEANETGRTNIADLRPAMPKRDGEVGEFARLSGCDLLVGGVSST